MLSSLKESRNWNWYNWYNHTFSLEGTGRLKLLGKDPYLRFPAKFGISRGVWWRLDFFGMFGDRFSDPKYPHISGGKTVVHPRKLTCPLKRDYFNRKYIFQPLIFRGYVSFREGTHDGSMQGRLITPVITFSLGHLEVAHFTPLIQWSAIGAHRSVGGTGQLAWRELVSFRSFCCFLRALSTQKKQGKILYLLTANGGNCAICPAGPKKTQENPIPYRHPGVIAAEVWCLGYVFGVQSYLPRRWPWMSRDWQETAGICWRSSVNGNPETGKKCGSCNKGPTAVDGVPSYMYWLI